MFCSFSKILMRSPWKASFNSKQPYGGSLQRVSQLVNIKRKGTFLTTLKFIT